MPSDARLGELLISFAGLDPPAWALEARVRERAAALDLTPDAYAAHVVADADELQRLIELLRVGETRFFRHQKQLAALADRVFPSLLNPVAAWSAGCASGEEAWTLAMLLCERGLTFSLLATDLSATALGRARDGRYPAAAVTRDVPAALVPRYFRGIGEEHVVNDRLRGCVKFAAHNLLGAAYPRGLDLIACRNVLIYFDEQRRAEVVSRLVRALKPGGWLLVGYSETLRDCPDLDAEAGALYRKRDAARSKLPPSKSQPIALGAVPSAPLSASASASNVISFAAAKAQNGARVQNATQPQNGSEQPFQRGLRDRGNGTPDSHARSQEQHSHDQQSHDQRSHSQHPRDQQSHSQHSRSHDQQSHGQRSHDQHSHSHGQHASHSHGQHSSHSHGQHASHSHAHDPHARTLVLRGDYHDGQRLAAELRPLLADGGAHHGRRTTIVDLDGASFLGDDAARVLRRAAEAAPGLELRATRPPVRRWLARHRLGSRPL